MRGGGGLDRCTGARVAALTDARVLESRPDRLNHEDAP